MPELLIAGFILISLIAYTLSGGADFGGGVWDLLASRGEEGRKQRDLIAHAIAPIWEANHVWLIVIIVLLFVCFPPVFAAITTALHVPLTLMLIGIMLRGSAFVFRSYGARDDADIRRWGQVFAVSSTITPLFLGVTLGAVVSGEITVTSPYGAVETDFISEWLAPFPFATGLFVLALFAFLAAVYLALETDDEALQEHFRLRAIASAIATGVLAFLGLLLAPDKLGEGLLGAAWSIPLQLLTGAVAIGAIAALVQRRYPLARVLAMAQATLVVCGLGFALYPELIPGSLSIWEAAAPANVLWTTFAGLCAGLVLLVPAFIYLYRVFKAPQAE